MEIFAFIAALVLLGPIAKAVAHRIARGAPDAAELRKQLRATELRLNETELRLIAVEERVDFYEKLLAKPLESREPPV